MKWRKPSEDLVKAFDVALPRTALVERRKMFGFPSAFVRGNMFAGIFQDSVMVRLSEAERKSLIRKGWSQFEPMPGRPMKEYLSVPGSIVAAPSQLREWLKNAFDYASSLEPKVKGIKAKKQA